ncbi:hypothetical protein MHYP_G00034630 [Metynnis hypsauchen]
MYLAAISACHICIGDKPVVQHPLVCRFMKGARHKWPVSRLLVPPWDLSLVLDAPCCHPFEPLEGVELKFLSLKTVLLLALTTAKRVGDLQALSTRPSCLQFDQATRECACVLILHLCRRLSHWIVEAIALAYKCKGSQPPVGLRDHSRGIATSWALFRGVSVLDLCTDASWASGNPFVHFYRLDVTGLSLVHAVLGEDASASV